VQVVQPSPTPATDLEKIPPSVCRPEHQKIALRRLPPGQIPITSPARLFDPLSDGDSRDAQFQEVLDAYREEHPLPKGINPIITGRLFTSLDPDLSPSPPIIPTIGLKFGALR
jgi:hypothetical protein